MGGFLFYVTVFHSHPLLNFGVEFCMMFILNFLQLKLEDYKDRLKKGETLNQDQLVSLLLCRSGRPQNLLIWQEGWIAEGDGGVYTEGLPTGLQRYFSQNQINNLLVIRLNVEPTSSVSCFNLHGIP